MENPVEFFQYCDNIDVASARGGYVSSYVSCIKIRGKPILPPLMTDEKRTESNEYKKKAIQVERKLSEIKRKSQTYVKVHQISSEDASIVDVPPYRQSTPTRPASLSLMPNTPGRTYVLPPSDSIPILHRTNLVFDDHPSVGNVSSHKSTKNVEKSFRSSLELRLASEDDVVFRNRRNKLKQSPILEENYPLITDELESDSDSRKERKRWSPLKLDSLNSLRIQLPQKDTEETDDHLEISLEETITPSPNLIRQNSYTLLTPSPALLNYLEAHKENTQRSQSGRKTWDLSEAKKNWEPTAVKLCKSLDEGHVSDDSELNPLGKRNSSSLDSFSVVQKELNRTSSPKGSLGTPSTIFRDDGSTSPSSYSSKKNNQKIRCKIKNKKSKPKHVPSPKAMENVPLKNGSNSTQGVQNVENIENVENASVPSEIKGELTDLSNLLLKMKFEHDRQKKELEQKQQMELQQLELIFKRKETELLEKVQHMQSVRSASRRSNRSIYSQYNPARGSAEFDARMTGDAGHNSGAFRAQEEFLRRTGKEYHPQSYHVQGHSGHSGRSRQSVHSGRRTRSMELNQSTCTQDTDLDISFQDDSLHCRSAAQANEDPFESDSVSSFNSQSSTLSSETRQETIPLLEDKHYMAPEEFQKYNQAAILITAAARGFLIRRLLRTAHVQGLITTLRDAISCATQLRSASDLGESDVDLMNRLRRQIEAAWEAVYSVFFNTPTSEKLQLISSDRERLRNVTERLTTPDTVKRISSATEKSLRRKKSSASLMSKSQTSNGCGTIRTCCKMTSSYPGPMSRYKLK